MIEDISSVLDLRKAVDSARTDYLLALIIGVRSRGLFSLWHCCEQKLLDAEWRLAVESHRWLKSPGPFDCIGEWSWWEGQRLVSAWRYGGVIPGPSREIAIRGGGVVSQ